MLSLREVAEVLGFAENTVYNEWRIWGIPFYRPGGVGKGRLRVKERDLWAWLETRQAALCKRYQARFTRPSWTSG